jgi:hypothetical protein
MRDRKCIKKTLSYEDLLVLSGLKKNITSDLVQIITDTLQLHFCSSMFFCVISPNKNVGDRDRAGLNPMHFFL